MICNSKASDKGHRELWHALIGVNLHLAGVQQALYDSREPMRLVHVKLLHTKPHNPSLTTDKQIQSIYSYDFCRLHTNEFLTSLKWSDEEKCVVKTKIAISIPTIGNRK